MTKEVSNKDVGGEIRNKSVLTGKGNLEHLHTFKNYPVFMGCTDDSIKKDLVADMSFSICKDTGIIQLDKLLPLNVVYQRQHAEGIGKTWQDHYLAFASFLEKFSPRNILEIGGANDFIAKTYTDRNKESRWTIVEPHPLFVPTGRVKMITDWFDGSFKLDRKVDAVVHSHVLEHIYNPDEFLKHVSTFLNTGGMHIFTFPNMKYQLLNMHTNCLNFEHTLFLTEDIVEYLLSKYNFKIVEKYYYLNHSIFYSTVKVKKEEIDKVSLPKKYKEYKKLFIDYIKYYDNLTKRFNKEIRKIRGNIYLFGAHVFSQHLLIAGLNQEKILSVLDNSPIKQGKRLYGTKFRVQSPDIIRNEKDLAIVLKAAAYQDEIRKQLLDINPGVIVLE